MFERAPRVDLAGKRGLVGRELRALLRRTEESVVAMRRQGLPAHAASEFGALIRLIGEAQELADVLSIARPHRSSGLQSVDLNSFLRSHEPAFRRDVDSRVLVTVRPSPASAVVTTNLAELEAVIRHLVCRAAGEMLAGGELVISTGWLDHVPYETPFGELRAEPHARLTVSDTGAGFRDDLHARVFHTPVEDLDASVAAIVHRIGGCLILEHEAGQGSRVHICLPVE